MPKVGRQEARASGMSFFTSRRPHDPRRDHQAQIAEPHKELAAPPPRAKPTVLARLDQPQAKIRPPRPTLLRDDLHRKYRPFLAPNRGSGPWAPNLSSPCSLGAILTPGSPRSRKAST